LFARGLGHPEQPLPDVRRPDARSAQIGSPNRIADCFQVSSYSGEPFTSILARDLFSKNNCRSADLDKLKPDRPEMAFVEFPTPLSGARKRLARAASRPNRGICRPAGELEGKGPTADSRKEVALRVSCEFFGFDFCN
jgi:hypothetical protein